MTDDGWGLMYLGLSQAWMIASWFARERFDSKLMLIIGGCWLAAYMATALT